MACRLHQHPTTACSGKIQNRFPATNSAQKHRLEAQAAGPAEKGRELQGMDMAELFPEKAGTCSSCLTLKVIFLAIGPVVMNKVFVWIKMSLLRNKRG